MSEWKVYQQMYRDLVTDDPDGFDKVEVVEREELVENAKQYFLTDTFPLIYPAKSMSVAVIYALLLEETYGAHIFDVLKDPDLFLGQDPYFRTYDQHPNEYDQLIEWVLAQPNWKQMGWAPKTCEYFRLECTLEGITEIAEEA